MRFRVVQDVPGRKPQETVIIGEAEYIELAAAYLSNHLRKRGPGFFTPRVEERVSDVSAEGGQSNRWKVVAE